MIISSKFIPYSILVLISAYFITKLLHQNNHSNFSQSLQLLPVDDAFGPESLTFDPRGDGPYAGVSDGRIVKWDPHLSLWVNFAFTSPNREECENGQNHEEIEHKCGRPLGLCFNDKTGELYIADAHMGLLVVGQEGGLARKVVTEVDGIPLGFTNGVDIDQDSGLVYFTSSSTRYPRRKYMSVILSNDNSGRLLQYDPMTNQSKTLQNNLSFPNGVALSKNKDFILVVETTTCKVLRHWLQNSLEPGKTELFIDLPGFPDNIKMNSKGEYWVGMYSKREKFLKWVMSFPWVGNVVVNLPFDGVTIITSFLARLKAIGLAVKLDEEGKTVKVLEDKSGKLKFVSEVVEKDGNLWFGSVKMPYACLYKDYDS